MTPDRSKGFPIRRTSTSAQRLELLAFVEGEKTEDLYITDLRRRHRDRVLVTVDRYNGAPLQLVQHAIAAKKRETREAKMGRGRAHDQIWCVFDVDEHPHLDEAIELAAHNGINLAVSNPCIELWFILHFDDQTAYIARKTAQRRAEILLKCDKVLSQATLDALAEKQLTALERAKKLDAKHFGDGSPAGSNPTAGIWRLVETIRDARNSSGNP